MTYILNVAGLKEADDLSKGAFCRKLIAVCDNIGVSTDLLTPSIGYESGFKAGATNKYSGAYGLIQWIDAGHIAKAKKLDAVQQLDMVEQWFLPYKGRLKTMTDVYLAIFYPADIGFDPKAKLARANAPSKFERRVYEQNIGFDKNHDGVITIAEISATVMKLHLDALGRPKLSIDTEVTQS